MTIPDSWSRLLESGYGVCLDGIRLVFSDLPGQLGAQAVAFDESIHLAEPYWRTCRQPLRVLAHEMAHLLQQRWGCVEGVVEHGSIPVNRDPRLEAEADRMADFVLSGGRLKVDRRRCERATSPVAQCLVYLGNRPVEFRRVEGKGYQTNLPEELVDIIQFIEGGSQFLAWASNEPQVSISYASAAQLIEGLTEGLHQSPVLLIPHRNLWISPYRLMELPAELRRALVKTEEKIDETTLRSHELYTKAVHSLTGFAPKDPKDMTLWTQVGLGGEILLNQLAKSLEEETQQLQGKAIPKRVLNKASKFADGAADIRGFVERYWFCIIYYLKLSQKELGPDSADTVTDLAVEGLEADWEMMLGFSVEYLVSPTFGENIANDRCITLIREWLVDLNGAVGFRTVGTAACNFLKYTSFLDSPGDDASSTEQGRQSREVAAQDYYAKAQSLLRSAPGKFLYTSQDGSERIFEFRLFDQLAMVSVDSSGTTVLETYSPGSSSS